MLLTIFRDDFQRADGALGGNWVDQAGASKITGGYAGGNAQSASTYDTTVADATKLKASGYVAIPTNSTNFVAPAVKLGTGGTACYLAYIRYAASIHYLSIGYQSTSLTVLASLQLSEPVPAYGKLTIEWNEGHLIATWLDTYSVEADDSALAAGQYGGFRASGAYQYLNDITIVGGDEPTLSIDPTVIPNYGECSTVVLTGVGTAWTAGTPGTPTFTVNHGTITAQEVTDATHVTLTYCPGDWLGTATFTDPSTGQTVSALVTSDPSISPPGSICPFNDAFVDMANETGTYYTPSRLMTIDSTIDLVPPLTIPYALSLIYQYMRAVVGGLEPDDPDLPTVDLLWKVLNNRNVQTDYAWTPTRDTSLKEDLEYLVNEFFTVRGDNEHTFQTMLDQLSGSPGANLQDVYTLVQGLPEADIQSVLDAIAAARGTPVANVREVVTHLDALRTINDWTLGNVKTWIEAVEGGSVDLTPVLTAISNLSSQLTTTQTNIRNDIAALGLVVVAVQTTVGAVSTAVGGLVTAVADVAEALALLHNTPSPALWPGAANATLGTEVALVDQLELTEAMHGVLVNVTTPPTRTGRREIGGHLMDYGVGEISFVADNGYIEPWQYMGFRTAIFTPRTMEVAAGAVFRVLAGAGGTVTPWTRT